MLPKVAINWSSKRKFSPVDEERANLTMDSKEAFTWWTGVHLQSILQSRTCCSQCTSPEQAKELADKMIGKHLITKQTGAQGRICNAVSCTFFDLHMVL